MEGQHMAKQKSSGGKRASPGASKAALEGAKPHAAPPPGEGWYLWKGNWFKDGPTKSGPNPHLPGDVAPDSAEPEYSRGPSPRPAIDADQGGVRERLGLAILHAEDRTEWLCNALKHVCHVSRARQKRGLGTRPSIVDWSAAGVGLPADLAETVRRKGGDGDAEWVATIRMTKQAYTDWLAAIDEGLDAAKAATDELDGPHTPPMARWCYRVRADLLHLRGCAPPLRGGPDEMIQLLVSYAVAHATRPVKVPGTSRPSTLRQLKVKLRALGRRTRAMTVRRFELAGASSRPTDEADGNYDPRYKSRPPPDDEITLADAQRMYENLSDTNVRRLFKDRVLTDYRRDPKRNTKIILSKAELRKAGLPLRAGPLTARPGRRKTKGA